MAKSSSKTPRAVCTNRRARRDYEILDRFEAGMVLTGSEVKSLREGRANLADAYVLLGEAGPVLRHLEIAAYSHDASGTGDTRRDRRLLLHEAEIRRLRHRLREKGLTLVPLSVYFKGPWAKVEVGIGRGRRRHDKRELLKAKAAARDMERTRRRRP